MSRQLPELPRDPLMRAIDKIGPFVQKAYYPIIGTITTFEGYEAISALRSGNVGNALIDIGVTAFVIGGAYVNHLIKTAPEVYQHVQSLVFEEPYRAHVEGLVDTVAARIDEKYQLAQQFNLQGEKAGVFHAYLAAHLLSRENVLPSTLHDLDPEVALEMAADTARLMNDPGRQLWYEQMPLIHGRVKEELLGEANDRAKGITHGKDGHWDGRQIEIAAEAVAHAYGPHIHLDLYEAFLPLALQAAQHPEGLTRRENRQRQILLNELQQVMQRVEAHHAANPPTPELDQQIERAVANSIYRIGTN